MNSNAISTQQPEVRDANGKPISKASIVGMNDPHGPWSQYQGLVVDPSSNLEGYDYTVAVYFFSEVNSSNFNRLAKGGIGTIDDWDELHRDKDGQTDFLFENDVWKLSPRVRFFKPSELVVLESWPLETLAKRLFKGMYHRIYGISLNYPQTPESYMCWIEGCANPAKTSALCNIHGSIFVLYVCDTCKGNVNGRCSDDLPSTKRSFLHPDGTIIERKK